MRLFCFCSLAAIGCLLIGCSDRADQSSPGKSPELSETVGIVLEGKGPRLQVGVTFLGGVAPEPHVQPIAAVLTKARESCFSGEAPAAGAGKTADAVAVRARVDAGKIHVVSPGSKGSCLAKALDGASIEDPAKYEVHIEVMPSP
jgi:hypothetical protein